MEATNGNTITIGALIQRGAKWLCTHTYAHLHLFSSRYGGIHEVSIQGIHKDCRDLDTEGALSYFVDTYAHFGLYPYRYRGCSIKSPFIWGFIKLNPHGGVQVNFLKKSIFARKCKNIHNGRANSNLPMNHLSWGGNGWRGSIYQSVFLLEVEWNFQICTGK